MKSLEWTETPPTEFGDYWHWTGDPEERPQVVDVSVAVGGKLYGAFPLQPELLPLEGGLWWPIPVAHPPKLIGSFASTGEFRETVCINLEGVSLPLSRQRAQETPTPIQPRPFMTQFLKGIVHGIIIFSITQFLKGIVHGIIIFSIAIVVGESIGVIPAVATALGLYLITLD